MINMGTNLFFEISFITNSVSPILQLAVSLDYAIFLLHSFATIENTRCGRSHAALIKASSTPCASATTLFDFRPCIHEFPHRG